MTDEGLLAEQIAYYRAIAGEYEDHAIDAPGQSQLVAAFDRFQISGHVLELACGPGHWTRRIVPGATSLTAVDASPEMIARAQSQLGESPVRFIESDLFHWQPDRQYDSVFFGFWLSHVPGARFETFWDLVASCLHPEGRVFFVDDNHRTDQELIEGSGSPIVERQLNDGTTYRAIKVPHHSDTLEERLHSLGWNITVAEAGPFYWGSGARAPSKAA